MFGTGTWPEDPLTRNVVWPVPPGSGRGDFVSLVAALKEVGYAGYLAMEIGFNRRDVEPDWVARQAYDYMKPLLDH